MATNRTRHHPAQPDTDGGDTNPVALADGMEAPLADPEQTGEVSTLADPPQGGTASMPDAGMTTGAPDTGAGKRKYQRKDPLKPVPVDSLGEEEDVPEEEWSVTPLTDSSAERSESQKIIDAAFGELHAKWVAAGRPEPRQSPRSRRVIAPEHAPAIRKMIAEAAKLHDVNVKFAPAAFGQDGREVIVYSPAVKVKRPRRPSTIVSADQESAPSASGGSLPGEKIPAPE